MLHDALADLHARACRTALDVFHLLESGLAAGAMARCRTLHELAVISMVLREYSSHEGHGLAERFLIITTHRIDATLEHTKITMPRLE